MIEIACVIIIFQNVCQSDNSEINYQDFKKSLTSFISMVFIGTSYPIPADSSSPYS